MDAEVTTPTGAGGGTSAGTEAVDAVALAIHETLELAVNCLPALLIALGAICALSLFRRFFRRRPVFAHAHVLLRNLLYVTLAASGLIGTLISLPVEEGLRHSLMQLLGILVGVAIALSSTTFVGNAMAGFMLRIVRSFRFGDYIRVGDHAGCVSEQGVFHIELQNEDNNLITLPNLYLVTHPVTVIGRKGTVIGAQVSLGYDVSHQKIEVALHEAAAAAGLAEAFVQVRELGDDSVTYRCAGLLHEAAGVEKGRCRLRAKMLDSLHAAGIEIVSPSFVTRRALSPDRAVVPEEAISPEAESTVAIAPPETVTFDKAKLAASMSQYETRIAELKGEEESLTETLVSESDETLVKALRTQITRNQTYQKALESQLKEARTVLIEEDDTIM
ncbi:MAG: mechanosensitive ion channel family protein [Planctomycetota bacterium]|jgi:small-conductance mechanosensitive channel